MYTGYGVLYVTQWCFRAGNKPSGPDFGRIAAGKTPKSAEGRPEGRFRCSSLAKIRPGRPIYGPEALLRNIEYEIMQMLQGSHQSWVYFGPECTIKLSLVPQQMPQDRHGLELVLYVAQ